MQDLRWPVYPRRETFLDAGDGPASVRVRDSSGKVYLDAVNGIGCGVLGHGHPRWVSVISEQLARLACAANSYRTRPQAELAERLAEVMPIRNGRVFFANTGTESTEAALKLALKCTGRDMILAFKGAFHGRTLGSIALTANAKYRDPYVNTHGEGFDDRFAHMRVIRAPFNEPNALDEIFKRYGSRLAATFIETIQGEAGVFPCSQSFLLKLRELCDRHGALLGIDEIQAGFGRTGDWTAWKTIVGDLAQPDVVWLAKALGGGYPIGACIARADLAEQMGLGTHGTTFGGNPVACRASLITMQIIEEEGLLASARAQLPTLRDIAQLDPIAEVTEIRGHGAMIGIQIGQRDQQRAAALGDAMMEQGVLVTTPGNHSVRVLLPYRAGRTELLELWQALGRAIRSTGGSDGD